MIKEALEWIDSQNRDATFEDCEGIERICDSKVALRPPLAPSTLGSSLDAAVEVARALSVKELVAVEVSWESVAVSTIVAFNLTEHKQIRHTSAAILPSGFPFGLPLDIETFIVQASDFFERNEQFKKLIASVSSIVEVNEAVVDDDGMSQTVTLKNRVGRKDSDKLDPIQRLRAFRTFREVEQPEADYLLRIGKERYGPTITLHEASGYLWKVEATEAVYSYVKTRVGEGATVIR